MIVYKFKGYTLLQAENWQYTIVDENNEVIAKGLSSLPLTREEARRILKYTKGVKYDVGVGDIGDHDDRDPVGLQ